MVLPAGRKPRWHWTHQRLALFGIPAVIVAVAAAVFLGPVLFQTWRAYGKIFVNARSHRVMLNAQGTPVIDPNSAAVSANWDKKVNIVLLGADTSPDRRKEGEIPLSDTIILVSVDPLSKQIGLLSIARDLLVTIPGVGKDKINAAYSNGELSQLTGPGLVEATIEYNFGIPIHYFAEVDFEGFKKIVDTLGGVTFDVPAPIKDEEYPSEANNYTRVYFATGLQHLDGKTALRYVRTRHDDNDFARGLRQQQLLRALRQQAVDRNLLPKASQLISALGDTVRTDLQPTDLLKLARLGSEITEGDIRSYSILDALTEQSSPGQPYYLIPDWDKIHLVLQQMMPDVTTSVQPTPSIQSVAKPVRDTPILVENATQQEKLAARAAIKLREQSFINVTVGPSRGGRCAAFHDQQ
jgi:LCP family protein required for cell wall assembly